MMLDDMFFSLLIIIAKENHCGLLEKKMLLKDYIYTNDQMHGEKSLRLTRLNSVGLAFRWRR
jgi:hypothetical protein